MSNLVKVTDHVADAQALMPEQHRDQTNTEDLIGALVSPIQDMEDTLYQLLTEVAVSTAVGVQLTRLGTIVGQERTTDDDDLFRRYVRARVATNKSNGLTNELLNIARLILDDVGISLSIEPTPPAGLIVRCETTAVASSVADILISFLRDAKAAGVRLQLITQTDVDVEMFTFSDATYLSGAESGGSTSLNLSKAVPTSWPASGSIIIAQGRAAEETVAYSAISNDRLTITCSATASAHDAGDTVQWANEPGGGFVVYDTPAFQSVYSSSNPIGGNLPLSRPSGTADGDTLVAFIWSATDQITSAPDGWSLVDSVTRTVDGNTLYGYAYVKIAASEPSSYIWAFDASTDGRIGSILRLDGMFSTQPDATGTDVSCESGTNHAQSAITTIVPNTLLVYAWMTDRTGSGSMAGQMVPPGSMTERVDTLASSSGRTDMGLMIATEVVTSDTSVGSRTATSTAADIFSSGIRVVLAAGSTAGGQLSEVRE